VVAWKAEAGATLFIHYTSRGGPGATYNRCRAVGGETTTGLTGFYSHTSGGAKHAAITYNDCAVVGADIGFSGNDATAIVINKGRTYRVVQAITGAPDSLSVNGGIFNGVSATATMTRLYTGASPAISISDAAVVARTSTFGLIHGMTGSLSVQRSTFAFHDKTGTDWRLMYAAPSSFLFRNNVIYGASAVFAGLNADATLSANGNVYHPASAAAAWRKVAYPNVAAYLTAVAPQESTSVTGDPLFSGNLAYGDVRISTGSPALRLGAGATQAPGLVLDRAYWDALGTVTR
jgi:hypothetical protein